MLNSLVMSRFEFLSLKFYLLLTSYHSLNRFDIVDPGCSARVSDD